MLYKMLTILACICTAVLCYGSEKFVYNSISGDILSLEPDETIRSGQLILGSQVWRVEDNNPKLAESDYLFYQVIVTNIDYSNQSKYINTNRVIRGNISELTSYTDL